MKIMGHLICDYPDRSSARSMIAAMVEAGVEWIEIQIPFSEPVADGPLFLAANHKALASGVRPSHGFELAKEVTGAWPQVNFLFMTYLNPVFRIGYKEFVDKAQQAGVKGMIVPDLPCEYSTELEDHLSTANMFNVRLIAPNTTTDRKKLLCSTSKGLIYAVARTGVTGSETTFADDLRSYIKSIKDHTSTPVAVGFGVRSSKDVQFLKNAGADIAVIGSEGMRQYAHGIDAYRKFWEEMVAAANQN